MIAKSFIEVKLKSKISENPMCMSHSNVKGKSVVLDVEGSGGGQWSFDFDSNGAIVIGINVNDSDCTIWMKDETFEKMIDGSLNVPFAFMMRKIKVKGEVGLAASVGLALQKLFK